MTTWRKLITETMKAEWESWSSVIACTLSDDELDKEFDNSFGAVEGQPFTLWTANRVYFPRCYDGHESVASVPRNPCNEPTEHIGGD